MSDSLAASLERLHNARLETMVEHDPEPVTFTTRALESRRQLRTQTISHEIEPDPDESGGEWLAAAQGRMAELDDAHQGKARLALGVRAALAGVFALLALGGGIVSAHLLTATAKPTAIISTSRDDGETAGAESQVVPSADAGAAPSGLPAEVVVVHVAGAVANPGIVELAAGSRVAYAVDQAGGALPEADLSAINLARVLVDGEQILIPLIGQQVYGQEPEPYVPQLDLTQVPDAEGRVNLNLAGSELLQQLPGIGPALAGRIIEYRSQVGGFGSVDQLQEISGIGPAVMNNVRDKVAV